jgi:hypothetical protein
MAAYLIPVTASKQEVFHPVAPVCQPPEYQRNELLADITRQLMARDFIIDDVKPISHGVQICLSCGAFVSIFKTGNVLLQGKLPRANYANTKALLLDALPANTRCCL